jgi:Uma2 family endonuclease
MSNTVRWTSADLEVMPDDGKRYEIIDGDLYVSKQPHWYHQLVCASVLASLRTWSKQTGAGVANLAPGVIFGDGDDVAPDVVWIGRERLAAALEEDGKLHAAPDLCVEVLSPGSVNERRDREAKLKLYSTRGVREYWIVDWRVRQVEVYRRREAQLELVATFRDEDVLSSPLLPEFSSAVATLLEDVPPQSDESQG